MSNQVAINTQILAFMKNPVAGAAGSPIVGSNSVVATPSRQAPVSCKDKAEVKAPPITRIYWRRAGKSAIESKVDPTYVPNSTPISSSEHGTFHFTHSNKRSTPSSRHQHSRTASTGKSKLFPINKDLACPFQSITMTFIPMEDMQIVGLDLAAAAYVFLPHMDQEEVLVPTPHCHLTRKALRSLEPGHVVDDAVLTMLAIMLKRQSTEFHWFLPTRLVEIGIKRCAIPQDTVAFIKKDFMGQADRVYKVVFLEGLMDDPSWYEDKTKQPLLISDYDIIEPDVVQQDPDRHGSYNDSGVFVAQWMIMHYLWGTSDVERVSAYSRMRLAIDIVLKDHNADRVAFIDKALAYWRVFAPPPVDNK
ncbi:hypothetical protein PIB30_085220 [Stylosanthes scabra]|uniref:Uncharacterized protein n=1 Tax=Stylosanthes scabra TaxID=79078 RepID=A0ABU6SUY5_9FABA|nr:hypothetical protein [Stylosanthes scabra]